MCVGLALASGTLLRIISKNLVLISVVSKKLSPMWGCKMETVSRNTGYLKILDGRLI